MFPLPMCHRLATTEMRARHGQTDDVRSRIKVIIYAAAKCSGAKKNRDEKKYEKVSPPSNTFFYTMQDDMPYHRKKERRLRDTTVSTTEITEPSFFLPHTQTAPATCRLTEGHINGEISSGVE